MPVSNLLFNRKWIVFRVGYPDEMNYWIVDTDEGFYSMCIGAFNEEGGNPGTPCVTGVVCAGDNGNVGAMELQAAKILTVLLLGRVTHHS